VKASVTIVPLEPVTVKTPDVVDPIRAVSKVLKVKNLSVRI
jgi:hypothetical protein